MYHPHNIILATDGYKIGHWSQYPHGTEGVYSYFESREGAEYPATLFFGLQSILKTFLEGQVVTQDDVEEAASLAAIYFGNDQQFNRAGWEHIVNQHDGKLPVRIKAVPEGLVVPCGNVLMTVENTDPACFWLTNALESLLTHVWYPSTVATRSYFVRQMLADRLTRAGASLDGLPFMLHDFGYRGAATHEAAAIAVAGHLVSFQGADSLPGLLLALEDYAATPETLGFSVPASEHSVMTALGRDGEFAQVSRLLDHHPSGVLSVVADSYDIYEFVDRIGTTFKDRIMARDGVFVVRPDSVTLRHPSPDSLTTALLARLEAYFGTTTNAKGFKVLDPHVRLLWGDGIDPHGIEKIIGGAMLHGFSPENLVFGMGGGLLQRVNRDTQRFAFKSSAQKRDGEWFDVYKEPLDTTKRSKRGRLKLVRMAPHGYATIREDQSGDDLLKTVFEDGELRNEQMFDEIRFRAGTL